jgi:hypothetical protein
MATKKKKGKKANLFFTLLSLSWLDPQHCFLGKSLSLPDQSTTAAHKARVRLGEGKDDLVPAGVGGGAVVGGGAAPASTPPRGHPPLPPATRVRIVGLLQGRPEKGYQYSRRG